VLLTTLTLEMQLVAVFFFVCLVSFAQAQTAIQNCTNDYDTCITNAAGNADAICTCYSALYPCYYSANPTSFENVYEPICIALRATCSTLICGSTAPTSPTAPTTAGGCTNDYNTCITNAAGNADAICICYVALYPCYYADNPTSFENTYEPVCDAYRATCNTLTCRVVTPTTAPTAPTTGGNTPTNGNTPTSGSTLIASLALALLSALAVILF
jgi:hypothetical protein